MGIWLLGSAGCGQESAFIVQRHTPGRVLVPQALAASLAVGVGEDLRPEPDDPDAQWVVLAPGIPCWDLTIRPEQGLRLGDDQAYPFVRDLRATWVADLRASGLFAAVGEAEGEYRLEWSLHRGAAEQTYLPYTLGVFAGIVHLLGLPARHDLLVLSVSARLHAPNGEEYTSPVWTQQQGRTVWVYDHSVGWTARLTPLVGQVALALRVWLRECVEAAERARAAAAETPAPPG